MRSLTESDIESVRFAADFLHAQPEREWFRDQEELFRSLLHDVEVDPDFWTPSVDTWLYTARTIKEFVDFARLVGGVV